MKASIETVTGKIKLEELGKTLTHEHLALDFCTFYVPPPSQLTNIFENKIQLNNVGFIKQYPYSCRYNVNFCDDDTYKAVLKDVKIYKKYRGGTIVENSNYGLKRNIPYMKKISEETGVNVIIGTGHYVDATQDKINLEMSEEKMYDLMITELTKGCIDYPTIKAGFIGEVGSSWPITDFEKKAIRATAKVQQQLNCPVTFHPGRNPKAPFEIIRIYTEAGGNVDKAIMSHLDRTIDDKCQLLEFAKLGCYTQFDLFGTECSFYQLDEKINMPSDAQRLDRINWIKNDNGVDKILMSHDIHTKHRLIEYGGHGYSHIITNVLPRMNSKGFSSNEIDMITTINPKTWLTW